MTHRHELAAYQRALMLTVDLREFTKTVAAALKDGHSFVNVMLDWPEPIGNAIRELLPPRDL